MGRTLPPLFRTVRRVVRILLTRTPCRFLHRVLQNSVKGSIFVLQISVKQKLRGWLWLSFGYIPPFRLRISFNVLLFACFRPVKKKPVAVAVSVLRLCLLFLPVPFLAFSYRLMHNILKARPCVKQRPTRAILSIISIIYTAFSQRCEKARCIKGFRRFCAVFPCPFFGGVLPIFRG